MRSLPYLSNKYTAEGEVGRRNCYQQTSGRAVVPLGWIFLSHTPEYRWISFVTVDSTKKFRSKPFSLGVCEAKTNYVVGVIIKTLYLSLSSLQGRSAGNCGEKPGSCLSIFSDKLHRFSCTSVRQALRHIRLDGKKWSFQKRNQKWP